jgi:hypothetical protein
MVVAGEVYINKSISLERVAFVGNSHVIEAQRTALRLELLA